MASALGSLVALASTPPDSLAEDCCAPSMMKNAGADQKALGGRNELHSGRSGRALF
jgi:hypothetical protein